MENCAANSVKMAAQGGVKFTKAGATFPYGKDPRDRNIRIAPTFPNLEQLINAVKVLCVCIKITALEKLINKV
jgi:DNA-binding transcriptional MocR family regulator